MSLARPLRFRDGMIPVLQQTIRDRHFYYEYNTVEDIRKQLSRSRQVLNRMDWGAGTASPGRQVRVKVSSVARRGSVTNRQGRLLFRIARYLRPAAILELGTSLGISTLYLATGAPGAQVITVEGCPETSRMARDLFRSSGSANIRLVQGKFDDVLPEIINEMTCPAIVFFDGNHTYEATMLYFSRCLSLAGEGSLFVFDDINWSRGMMKAWKAIRNHPQVTLSVDFFRMGMIFFGKDEHFGHYYMVF